MGKIKQIGLALLYALVIGFAHMGGHRMFGDPATFEAAGVPQAGIAVMIVAFIFGLIVAFKGKEVQKLVEK